MTTQLHNSTLELRDRLTLMGVPLPLALKRRDPKEPGRRQKEATEDKIYKAFQRNFAKQKREIREVLLRIAPERKSLFGYDLDYYLSQFDDEFWRDDDFIAKLGRILVGATAGGIDIFADLMPLEIDYTLVNEEAARWALERAGHLTGLVDTTTIKTLRGALHDFVTTPGMTIGDIVNRLPYDESRSLLIAVTETTNTYARAEKIAGEALQKEYPDVLVIKTWFTNQDDIVCPLCRPLHMVEVPIKDTFPGGIEQPPLHCRCRCWISTTTRLE